ncbi:hypothetical protein OIU79_004948 [Salix purpurea]|uniref:Uncharacterized protein n=1 Tax=Salix purpurea TaxID=77065 RepID=A0A9Q0UBI8_SALPP|nr:hypothetical protein OIU79_004948 [Salix purpurea]
MELACSVMPARSCDEAAAGNISITTGKAIMIHQEDVPGLVVTLKWLFLIAALVVTLAAAIYFGYEGLIWLSGWMDGVEEQRDRRWMCAWTQPIILSIHIDL